MGLCHRKPCSWLQFARVHIVASLRSVMQHILRACSPCLFYINFGCRVCVGDLLVGLLQEPKLKEVQKQNACRNDKSPCDDHQDLLMAGKLRFCSQCIKNKGSSSHYIKGSFKRILLDKLINPYSKENDSEEILSCMCIHVAVSGCKLLSSSLKL